jgi:hypothetical protein
MKKITIGLVAFAILVSGLIFYGVSRPAANVNATAATSNQTNSAATIDPVQVPKPTLDPGTVASWNSVDADSQEQWMDSQHELMRVSAGELAVTQERWLSAVAPELVYAEASKCGGNLRPSETNVCEVRWSKKMQRMFQKCGDQRPSDMRGCVLEMDPEVARQEAQKKPQ